MAGKRKKIQPVEIVDKSIQIYQVDYTLKTLATWKQAMVSAENIVQPVRKALYDLYHNVVLDDHLISVMGKRRRAVSRASIQFQIDGKPVDAMTDLIGKRAFTKLLTLMLDARLYGYSLIQVDLANDCVELVERANVVPSKTLVVATPYDTTGIDYSQPPYDRYYLGVGEVADLGLLFPAAYCVLLKRQDVTDWADFNEIFGQPLRVGKYDAHDPQQKAQLTESFKSAGKSAYVVLPDGSSVEFVAVNQTGAKDTFEAFAARMDKAISKVIIGQTMTTENGSSRSQAEVHERVADEIVMDDLKYLIGYLNEDVVPMLLAQGFPVGEGKFVVIEEEAKLSKKDRLDMDLKIHKDVAPIDIDYFAREYNVPIDQAALKLRQEQAAAAAEDPLADDEKPDKAPTKKDASPGKKEAEKKQLAATISPFSVRGLWRELKSLTLSGFFDQAPAQ